MKHLSIVLAFAALAAGIYAACDPPGGASTTCTSKGHPNPPDSTYSNVGPLIGWPCCNQNFVCLGCTPNPGVQFFKQATIYFTDSGSTCTDAAHASNIYANPAPCCACEVIVTPVDPNNPV